ncbi:nectin-2 [Anoplopoma fimbria]|uniref:nectin-2 n=1 Tax=Anoplopoma fimbria TaxID=229290 RepID=UPI0023ED7F90|nr:nectin-2 [Anoplopoma fimbria]
MAGEVLGTAFSLLLLASIIQGLQDVEVFQNKRMEAVVGQNVTLPCTVKKSPGLHISSIEWSKNNPENTKLAVYVPTMGLNMVWPNITMQIENVSMGYNLQLYRVTTQDSGLYTCSITSFPLGILRREILLEIKDDINIICDVESAVKVHSRENVTIKCRLFPDAKYKWTKNKTLVSENESLELSCVSDAHTGVYTLTVNTGNKSLHKEFIITVLTATTSLRTDLATMPPQSNVTEEGLIEPEDSGFTTSPTTGPSTTDSSVTWTTNMSTDVTDDNLNSRNVTVEEHGSKTSRTTYETRNESTGGHTGTAPTLSPANTTVVIEDEGTGGAQSHLLLLPITVLILVLIAAAGFLYFRKIMKERMDLPPTFKPPPPPVKYTAARHHEISTQPFPTARCNSVTELKDMKQMFINV